MEEAEVPQTAGADVAECSCRLKAAHPSTGQAYNERVNLTSQRLMLVQLVTFSLTNPLPAVKTGSAYTLGPELDRLGARALAPKCWPEVAALYQRTGPFSPLQTDLSGKRMGWGHVWILALQWASCVTLRTSLALSELMVSFPNEHPNVSPVRLIGGLNIIKHSHSGGAWQRLS